jgi:hypothetical protein
MSRLGLVVGAAALLAVSTVLFAAGPAGAQMYPGYPAFPPPSPPSFGFMPAHEADAMVRSMGLMPVAPPREHGPVIFVEAVGQDGSLVRVTVDRRSGRIRQIVRLGPAVPQMATIQPGPAYEEDVDTPPPPPYVQSRPGPYPYPSGPGPQVIGREDIQTQSLPPPAVGPRVVTREQEVAGAVPRTGAPMPIDPLLGVPPEFRNRTTGAETATKSAKEKVAARTQDETPRATPLPRPRPADAPSVARRDAAPPATPPAKSESAKPAAPAMKEGEKAGDFPTQPPE